MVFTRFVLLAALLLTAASVNAATTIDLGPSDYRRWGEGTYHHHTRGLNAKFGQTVRMPPMNTSLTVTRNPVIPYGSIANGMKNFVRINPASVAASAAITALFLGLDWVFDDELDSWAREAFDTAVPIDGMYWCAYQSSNLCGVNRRFPTPEEASAQFVAEWEAPQSSYVANSRVVGCVRERDALFMCEFSFDRTDIGGTYTQHHPVHRYGSVNCPENTVYLPERGYCAGSLMVPITDADVDSIDLPALPSPDVGSAANDIMKRQGAPLNGYSDMTMEGPQSTTGPETTTTTTTETGDSVVTTTSTTTNYNYGDTTITTTNTTTSTTYTNGNHTSTETTTETPGELPVTDSGGAPPAGEWPGFCDWATVVCDFIEWFQEPFDAPEIEWPLIEDQEFEEEFSYSLAATCPEPYTIELSLFPPVQFNWQPFCDLASFIKPLVLASAAIFAAFISLGIARART